MPTIFVTNRSTLITEADARTMTAACDSQLNTHVLPAWGLLSIPVKYDPQPPRGSWVITLLDTLDQADALGYHTENGSHVFGVVGAKVVLDQGAHALIGPYSVASILSHEVCELALDVHCSSWSDSGHGYLVATELADPVQSDWYVVGGCSVSNFVLPAYFDPQAKKGPFDYLGRLRKPFSLSKGGYWVQMVEGRVTQKFGEEMPDWLRAVKQHAASRTQRISSL